MHPVSDPVKSLYDYLELRQLWGRRIEIPRGQLLHVAGTVHTATYYVESGALRSWVTINNDEEQTIRFAYPGDFFTAIDSFVSGRPTLLSTQAIRATRLRIIPKSRFDGLLDSDPELNRIWQQLMAWMIAGQLDREIDLLTKDPAERYRRVLARSPRLFQEVPAKYIANYLRMTPETLSRCRAR